MGYASSSLFLKQRFQDKDCIFQNNDVFYKYERPYFAQYLVFYGHDNKISCRYWSDENPLLVTESNT